MVDGAWTSGFAGQMTRAHDQKAALPAGHASISYRPPALLAPFSAVGEHTTHATSIRKPPYAAKRSRS